MELEDGEIRQGIRRKSHTLSRSMAKNWKVEKLEDIRYVPARDIRVTH